MNLNNDISNFIVLKGDLTHVISDCNLLVHHLAITAFLQLTVMQLLTNYRANVSYCSNYLMVQENDSFMNNQKNSIYY